MLTRHLSRSPIALYILARTPTSRVKQKGRAQASPPFELLYCFLLPQILHMHIRAQPLVVRQIPSRMIRIFINNDWVRIPQPTIDVRHVKWRYAPIPVVEPEPPRSSTREMPNMARPEPAGEVSMRPRMVQMIVRIIAPRVMTDPAIAWIDVRRIRMTRMIVEMRGGPNRTRRSMKRLRAASRRRMRWNSAVWRPSMFLSPNRRRKKEQCCQCKRYAHTFLLDAGIFQARQPRGNQAAFQADKSSPTTVDATQLTRTSCTQQISARGGHSGRLLSGPAR